MWGFVAGMALAAEPSHPLALVATTAEHGFDVVVHNPTDQPVWLQIPKPDYNALTTALSDATGATLPPVPGPPLGRPLWTHRFERIPPDGRVRVSQLVFDPATARLRDNARTWDLSPQRGQTLEIRLGFTLACEERTLTPSEVPAMPGADNAAPPVTVEHVFCGALTADPLSWTVP